MIEAMLHERDVWLLIVIIINYSCLNFLLKFKKNDKHVIFLQNIFFNTIIIFYIYDLTQDYNCNGAYTCF